MDQQTVLPAAAAMGTGNVRDRAGRSRLAGRAFDLYPAKNWTIRSPASPPRHTATTGFTVMSPVPLEVHGIADYRARHAVAAAAAPAEFGADDGDDLDSGLTQQGIGAGVAVVGEHHAG